MKKDDALLRELETTPIVREAKKITITAELREKFGSKFAKEVEANRRFMVAYRLIYTSQGHAVVGYIVVPKKHATRAPTIVFNRGGSGEFGAIRIGWLFSGTIAALARAGYVVIASQYSGVAGGEGIDEMGGADLYDVLNLQKIIKNLSFCDAEKVGMYGISRGGMMTYLSLAKAPWIKAAITVGGLANLFRQEKLRPEMKKLYIQMFGGTPKEKKKRSAVFWADTFHKKTPLLIMHGSSDWRVNPLDSIELAEKLYENHIPYRLMLFEGSDHGLSEHENESTNMTLSWFERFVKNAEPLPNIKPHGS